MTMGQERKNSSADEKSFYVKFLFQLSNTSKIAVAQL